MAAPRNTNHGTGICSVCREEKSLTANLRIRSHRINKVPCAGGSDLPYDPAKDTEVLSGFGGDADRTSRVHPNDDVFGNDPFGDPDDTPSDPTDASTWTTETDDRPTLFEVRNARKVVDSALDGITVVPEEVLAEAERILEVYATEGVKGGPVAGGEESAAVLPETGQDQVNDPPAEPSHGGPNPHRAPLPRGHLAAVPDVRDDVNTFMGGSVKASGTSDDVNDFMSGDDPEEVNVPRYFPAKYDGNCETCGADFGEGEEIRADGSGGWEGKDCCGDSDSTSPAVQEKPKVVYPKLPVVNGRYSAPHPETMEKAKWTRVTNFNKKASDHFALEQWGNRCLAVGLQVRQDLFRQVEGKDVKADRNFLNKLVEEAKQAAGSKDRARLGTIMHKHTEEVDAGHKTLADVPEKFRNDVDVYQAKMRACGLMMVPHLMERSTVVTDLGVAGTFDGIARLPDGTYAVADKKTGETLEYSQFEIAVQLAVYAHGVNTSGIATAVSSNIEGEPPTWTWEKPRDEDGNVIRVREDIGIVIHLPYGSGECFVYDIPLDVGWEGAQLCKRVQESQKIKHIVTARQEIQPSGIVAELGKATAAPATDVFTETARGFKPPTAANTGRKPVLDWMEKFAAVTTKEEALDVYRQAQSAGVGPVVLKAGVGVGKGALQALAKKPDPELSIDTPPEMNWEDRFAAVTSKEEAEVLYRGAKSKGLPSGRLVELAEIGKAALKKLETPDQAPELTWEDRFAAVTTKDQARELYALARAEVATLGMTRLNALVKVARETLAQMEEPPF